MARSRKNHEPQREALIRIALDLFVEQGYENTTVTDIMRVSGLSKGGMYHYFSSKEEILDAVIQYGLRQELERTEAEVSRLPVEDRLPYLALSGNIGEFAQKLLGFSQANHDSIVGYRMREFNLHFCLPILQNIFEDGIKAGLFSMQYPQETAEFCMLMVRAIVDSNLLPPTNEDGVKRRIQVFMQLMRTGMGIEPGYAERLTRVFDHELEKAGEKAHGENKAEN